MPGTRPCRRCQATLDAASAFCGRCGTRQHEPPWPGAEPGGATALAPGWYADPFGRSVYRFWNGSIWTERVFDDGYGTDVLVLEHRERVHSAWPASAGSLAVTVVGLALSFGLSYLFVLPFLLAGHPGGPVVALALSETGLWIGLVGTCVVTSRRFGTGRLRQDFRVKVRLVDVPIALLGALVGRAVGAAAAVPVVASHRIVTNPDRALYALRRLGTPGWVVLALFTCVGAPLIEELYFRGLLQGQLAERFRPAVAIAVTAVVFGAAHVPNDPGFAGLVLGVSIGAAGVVLGVVRHLSGRLGSSIGTHALFNAIAIVALLATSSGVLRA